MVTGDSCCILVAYSLKFVAGQALFSRFWAVLAPPWGQLCPNLAPTWFLQSMASCFAIMTSCFVRFWIDFYSQLRPPICFLIPNFVFLKIAFRSWDLFWMRFWCQLGSILLPHFQQNRQTNNFKRHQNLNHV